MSETRLFVGNIPANATEQDLKNEFGYYGAVKRVELKQKNDDEYFAFVNLEIEEKVLQKCFREFSQQKFKGNFLSVTKAKESFLERLKREREEAQNPVKSINEETSKKYHEESSYDSYKILPKIEKEVSSEESSSEEEEEEKPEPVKKSQQSSTPIGLIKQHQTMTKAMVDDLKRKESFKKLKARHDEQKRAIKNALLAIDTAPRNNKIIFEPPESPPSENGVESNQNRKAKAQLFDEDEEEDEIPIESFKQKKQFAGKNGEKLFELQTRFQNDKRFKIDEKFADDVDDGFDSRKKYTREELKERKRMRKEMENWDQNELKEERDNQLSILEGITGESTGMLNSQKPTQKGMLRFDPSKKEHLKYLDLVKGDEIVDELNYNEKTNDENFKVSEEKFYEVSDALAQSLQHKSESKPFSIFEMLGVHHEDVAEEKPQTEEVKILKKLPTFHLNPVKFKYDSSDTDEEVEKFKAATQKKIVHKNAKGGKYSKSGVWRQNFFIADGDERLKEAFAFIKKIDSIPTESFDEKRRKLKQVIKSKIRKARSDQRNRERPSKKLKV